MKKWLAAGGMAIALALATGLGCFAATAGAATLPTPTDVTATPSNGEAQVFFDAVSPPNGAVYTYTVTVSPGGAQWPVTADGTTPGSIWAYNLTNGTPYTFTVTVSDASGDSSAASAPSTPVTPEPIVPAAPVDVTAASTSQGQAVVSFDSVNDDGGSPITGYTVTSSPGGIQATGTASPITVAGLTNGTAYTFTVTQDNAVGDSDPSSPSTAVTPLATPAATGLPEITGQAQVGTALQASSGSWNGQSDTFAYQWSDCATTCTAISGATNPDYVVTQYDAGSALEVTVTATNPNGDTGTASSEPTSAVPGYPPVSSTSAPTIKGTAEVDDTLSASTGSWTGDPTDFSYQWQDCDDSSGTFECSAIPGATGSTYQVDPLDGGEQIEVLVTAANGGNSGSQSSAATAAVVALPGAPVSITPPTVGAQVGAATRTGTAGTWSGAPTSFTYIWLSCPPDGSFCDVAGDGGLSYTPQRSDNDRVLVLAVVASNAHGDSVAALSNASEQVSFGPPPTITITAPANGEDFVPVIGSEGMQVGTGPPARYTCTPAPGTTLVSCYGPVADGAPIPFGLGSDSFTVTAVDSDGQSSTQTTSYTWGGALSVSVSSPVNGGSYLQGSTLDATFSCGGADPGAAVSCTATQTCPSAPSTFLPAGATANCVVAPQPSGSLLDTSTVGRHTVTMNYAVSYNGLIRQPVTTAVTYTVYAPPSSSPTALPAATSSPQNVRATDLSESSSRWREGVAAVLKLDLNEAATVTFKFSRTAAGRRVGGRCLAPSHANARRPGCTRTVAVGSITRQEPIGLDTIPVKSSIDGTKLVPGDYMVLVTAVATGSAAGLADRVGTLHFTVIENVRKAPRPPARSRISADSPPIRMATRRTLAPDPLSLCTVGAC